jgi:hypothetical protein
VNPGITIKLTKEEGGIITGAERQTLGYSLSDGTFVWYSLDAVNGAPFAGRELTVTSNEGGSIVWPDGTDIEV